MDDPNPLAWKNRLAMDRLAPGYICRGIYIDDVLMPVARKMRDGTVTASKTARQLSGPLFHISPRQNRSSIQAKGLVPDADGVVYASRQPHAFGNDFDVWVINPSGIQWVPDTWHAMDRGVGSVLTTEIVPPSQLRLLTPDEVEKVRRTLDDWNHDWDNDPPVSL